MAERWLEREDILRILKSLDLPREECWLTSGAALVLYGLRAGTHDVDLVCTAALADRLEAQGVPYHRSSRDGSRVFALTEDVEVLENWATEEIVELEGFRVAGLRSIRVQKAALGREKDLQDIARIDAFLANADPAPEDAKGPGIHSGRQNNGESREERMKSMFAVAIDGPAGAGKSSVAQAAAAELGFVYVDTGALYRTVGLYLLRRGIDPKDGAAVEPVLPEIEIRLEHSPEGQKMFLCGEEVTGLIRTEEVDRASSDCSTLPAVRAFLLDLQRDLARRSNVLMDGRDIGTVVLPDARLKVFLTAAPEERARRRAAQQQKKGKAPDYEKALRLIRERDAQDSTRDAAPLRQAEDALLLDTTDMTEAEAVATLAGWVRERMEEVAAG